MNLSVFETFFIVFFTLRDLLVLFFPCTIGDLLEDKPHSHERGKTVHFASDKKWIDLIEMMYLRVISASYLSLKVHV